MALDSENVRVLQELTLQVCAPVDSVPTAEVSATQIEIEQGVLTMARGGIEGALSAVNKVFPAGYGLRFKPAESVSLEVDTQELTPEEVREALGG